MNMAEGEGNQLDSVMQFETKQLQVRPRRRGETLSRGDADAFSHPHPPARHLTRRYLSTLSQELQQSRNELLSRVANLKKVGRAETGRDAAATV